MVSIDEVMNSDDSAVTYALRIKRPLAVSYVIGICILGLIIIAVVVNRNVLYEMITWRMRKERMDQEKGIRTNK